MATYSGRVGADVDDGVSFTGNTGVSFDEGYTSPFPDGGLYIQCGIAAFADVGFIWRATGIAPGSTINSATITFRRINSISGVTIVCTIRGMDVDSPPAFDDSHTHRLTAHVALTTASVVGDFAVASGTGTFTTVDITAILQEIVDRVGFGGDIGIILVADETAVVPAYQQLTDYDDDPAEAALLEIDYTPAAAGDPFPFSTRQRNTQAVLEQWPYSWYVVQRPNRNPELIAPVGNTEGWRPSRVSVRATVLAQHADVMWQAPIRGSSHAKILVGDGGPVPGVYDKWWYVLRRRRML